MRQIDLSNAYVDIANAEHLLEAASATLQRSGYELMGKYCELIRCRTHELVAEIANAYHVGERLGFNTPEEAKRWEQHRIKTLKSQREARS